MQKLYCYVDESGQDPKSEVFVVVAIVSAKNQAQVKKELTDIEDIAETHKLKWHKTRHDRKMRYLSLVINRKIAAGDVYTAHYQKPIPYFFPLIDLLEKARELTNALRVSGISLRMIKGCRDESEPLIRLADMWAGCMRSALLGQRAIALWRAERFLHGLRTASSCGRARAHP